MRRPSPDGVRVREGDEWSFRRLGFQALTFDLWPSPQETSVSLEITLKPVPITLGPVEVRGDVGRALTPWIRDFEDRRRQGWGTYLAEEDILEHRASSTATDLLRWAGVNVQGDVFTYRSIRVFGSHCWPPRPPLVFLDGMRLSEESALDWLDTYSPDQLVGVEVYASPADIPPMFNAVGSDCGVIAVWTKR